MSSTRGAGGVGGAWADGEMLEGASGPELGDAQRALVAGRTPADE